MCQDKIVDNVFSNQWIVWRLWFCFLNEKEQGTNQIVDISELKIENKLEPELQKENCGEYLPVLTSGYVS